MSTGSAGRWLLVAAGAVVVATVAASIAVIGPPAAQRELRLDARRLDDLRRIERLVDAHFTRTGALPAGLEALARPGLELPLDPASDAPYGYEAGAGRDYRLCAVFGTDSASSRLQRRESDEWSHGSGRQCFERRAPARDDDAGAERDPAPAP